MNKRFIVITSKDEVGEPGKLFPVVGPQQLTLPWVVKEKVGVGIINPRGIKRLTMVGKQ